jgi:hypothetical protein
MKKSKITLRLSRLSDADLEARSFGIVAAMTGNAHFPEPTPALADLNNTIKLFSDSLANYCSFIAEGDRFILASSGFTLNAERTNPATLADPTNFTVEVGSKTGDALAYVNAVPNAKAYLFRWGVAPIVNEAWFHTIHSLPFFTITGLVPGTVYSFQIGVSGSKGQVVYTDIISKMVV